MIHIVTSAIMPDEGFRLPFYLAVEEWVARYMPVGEYFFTWRVAPTVIFGRNQDVAKEVNLEYCRQHNIQAYRRRSGGGCVYSDYGNLMLSYIGPQTDVVDAFTHYSASVARMLRSLGINAEATGRNDVVIDGRKVSGNAFYRLPQRSIIHGTMLFDTNAENMANAITPSRSKLESNRVASVQSRITTLNRFLSEWSIEKFDDYVISYFTDEVYTLTAADLKTIRQIEATYYDLHWIFGRKGILSTPNITAMTSKRIPGVGAFNILLQIVNHKISEIEMTGDFFMLSDLDSAIFDKIKGCDFSRDALMHALASTDVSQTVAHLSTEAFVDLLLSASLPVKKEHKSK